MTRVILLDAGPLGMVTHPRGDRNRDVAAWLAKLLATGTSVLVPEIADYEVRRELLRAKKRVGVERLDSLKSTIGYLPISTKAMLKAAEPLGTSEAGRLCDSGFQSARRRRDPRRPSPNHGGGGRGQPRHRNHQRRPSVALRSRSKVAGHYLTKTRLGRITEAGRTGWSTNRVHWTGGRAPDCRGGDIGSSSCASPTAICRRSCGTAASVRCGRRAIPAAKAERGRKLPSVPRREPGELLAQPHDIAYDHQGRCMNILLGNDLG